MNYRIIRHADWKEHKYINKYTNENGKTVYVYSKLQDALGYDERKKAEDADYEYRKSKRENTNRGYSSQAEMNKASERTKELGKKAQEAYRKYKKTPLGTLEKLENTVNKGRNAAADALESLSKKMRPKR